VVTQSRKQVQLHFLFASGICNAKILRTIHVLLKDPNGDIRAEATQFIASRGDRKYLDDLRQLTGDKESRVRGFAVLGLKKINPKIFEYSDFTNFINSEKDTFVLDCISY